MINVFDGSCTITAKFFLKPEEKDKALAKMNVAPRVTVSR